jgi:hypothetical protein
LEASVNIHKVKKMNRLSVAVYLFIALSLILPSALYAEESSSGTTIGIFLNGGIGFANNIFMADRLNWRSDWAEVTYSGKEDEGERKEPIGYAGVDLEPRLFSGNLVYALSLGFYNVSTGVREVRGASTYRNEISLQMAAFRGSVYFKIGLSDKSFFLLGGGLGYYIGTMEDKIIINGVEQQSDEDTKWTIGWHTALEYNRLLFGSFVFSAGIMSRFAEIYNFQVNEVNEDDKFNGNITGLYLYVGVGYLF